MPDEANPYIPGQPASSPDRFFGRRDVVPLVREFLLKGRRVFLVAGEPRIGKSSVLHQLLHDVPEGFLPVRLDLLDEDIHPLDAIAWHLARSIAEQVRQRTGAELEDPAWRDWQGSPESLVDRLGPVVRRAAGDACLVLLADDVDALDGEGGEPCDSLLSLIEAWRDRDPEIALVTTVTHGADELVRRHPRLFGGAQIYTLTSLHSEEALRLINWPVGGALTYDHGVARRIIEVTSGHPYYLQLVCYEIFYRCSAAGWVNQRDVDLVVEELVRREISDFRDHWKDSSPPEQAVLAAMVSLRGARGVATVQEVRTALNRAGARVEPERVEDILNHLAVRGVLERLGALSYRFRVALMRDWLAQRISLEDSVRHTRWQAPLGPPAAEAKRAASPPSLGRRAQAPARPEKEYPPPQAAAAPELPAQPSALPAETKSHGRVPWLGVAVAVVLLAVLLATFLPGILAGRPIAPTTTLPAPTATSPAGVTASPSSPPALRSTAAAAALPTATGVAAVGSPAPTATPTLTPSPTRPVVISRPLPAIAYQSRAEGESTWTLCVMNSDGSNRTLLTRGQTTFLSAPSWSPGGDRIAYVSDQAGADDIWLIDLDGENAVNLTADQARDHGPVWSPDGESIAFASVRDALYWELYIMRSDGSNVRRLTWWEDASDLYPSWSPDSKRLAFASKRDGNWEIYVMDRDGSNLVRLTNNPADDTNPAWSPDGTRIAFVSLRDGYADIFVAPVSGGEPANISHAPFSTELGPTWSPDGSRIAFYSDREGEWDIFAMADDGSDVVKLTGADTDDQVPAWRP